MLASWRVSLSALFVVVISCMAQGQRPTPKAQEVFAPYWTSAPGWDTELQLKNNLASGSLTVTPVLRSAAGQEIPLDPVTIASNSSTSVWVNAGLLAHAPTLLSQPGSYGSVIFRFNSPNARNLYATVNLLLHGAPSPSMLKDTPQPPPRLLRARHLPAARKGFGDNLGQPRMMC